MQVCHVFRLICIVWEKCLENEISGFYIVIVKRWNYNLEMIYIIYYIKNIIYFLR